jgi:NAD(P)-dependent dehydrogenase (short-subunit alcohol dehydrogenase family)
MGANPLRPYCSLNTGNDFMNRIALITGANRGIGLEVCRQLAREGLQVILTSRDPDRGRTAAENLRGENLNVVYHPLDVTLPASVQNIHKHIKQQFGRLDVLVNNAGVYLDEGVSVFDMGLDALQTTFEVNTYGAFLMTQAFVPLMIENDYGRVVNVSSSLGAITQMGGYTAAYKMSKAALNALTRVVAGEVRGYNIKVNAADPGWVSTAMGGQTAPRTVEQGADTIVWLATLPDDGPTNGFFYERQPRMW